MSRQRRMLWASVSTSRKVNRLSDRAAILWTWAIPYFDDEGYMEGDCETLKARVVPIRDNISKKDIQKLRQEIIDVGLWMLHKVEREVRNPHPIDSSIFTKSAHEEEEFIQDPVFEEMQPVRGEKYPSKIKQLIKYSVKLTLEGSQDGSISVKELKCKGSVTEIEPTRLFPEKLMEFFNETTQYLPKVSEIGKVRREKIKTRIKEGKNSLDWWKTVFQKADSVLIPGRDGKKDWFPNFDWLIENERNAVKVFEGNYDDAKRPKTAKEMGKSFESAELFMQKMEEKDEYERQKKVPGSFIEDKGLSSRTKP